MAPSRAIGIVIAGGRGVRLGLGIPKALARVGGRTLLEIAVESLRGWFGEVLVVAPDTIDLPAVAGARRVTDAADLEGPLAGVVGGLEHAPDRDAFVRGVDFPFVAERFARALIAQREITGAPALMPAPGGVAQPLVAAYGRGAAGALRAAARGSFSITRAVLAIGGRSLGDAELANLEGATESLINVNTPSDLAAADARLPAAREADWKP